ncbi:MAG: hypothetical protein ABJE95_21845 [Byssovorax sp.]
MASWTRHLVAIVAVLLVAGCGGGGCSGCACAGVTPLAEGFKPEKRIENAGSVRVTDTGITFLQQNLGTLAKGLLGGGANGGVLTFDIPNTSSSFGGVIDYNVCPKGANPNANPPTCQAEINIGAANLAIDPKASQNLRIHGPLPIRLRDLPIDFTYLGFINDSATGVLDGDGTCPGGPEDYANIDIDVDIEIAADQNANHSRVGYSKLKVTLKVDEAQIQNALHFCGGSFSSGLINALKGVVFGQLIGPLLSTLTSQIDQQLCQKANPALNPTCPTGTNDVAGVCRYGTKDTDECASIVLGTDGHINLGGLLASISPGTTGGLDFLFAAGGLGKSDHHPGFAWGDLDPGTITNGVGDGFTLGMYGGAEPNPLSKCVKLSDLALPTGIPIPDELFGDTVKDWPAGTPGPHLGLAVSERFANYAMAGLYNSGLLCIGISTENVALLNSGTLGLLASSSKTLGLQGDAQQVAIVIRPSTAPTIAFGNGTSLDTDPLLRIKLNQAAFDFYIFSLDRYIRFMTATFDLDVPVNLTVTPAGLTPVLNKIGVTNGKVTNSSLLREHPETIAASLGDLIASQVGQLAGGGLKPINLNASLASLGLSLDIPDTVDGKGSPGLRKLSKGTDNYLGIFAAFGMPKPGPVPPPGSKTHAQLIAKKVDKKGLVFETVRDDNAPVASLYVGSSLDDGQHTIEYQYRVDQGFWHPYTQARRIDVQDGWLRVQGKHVIEVRSKVAGDPSTLDEEPAQVEVVVDAVAPTITIGKVEAGNKVALTFKDKVSGDRSVARVRLDGGKWTEWQLVPALATVDVGEAGDIDVEAKDEEGNVATASQELVRGRVEAGAAGCGCTVAGADQSTSGSIWLLGVAVAGIASRLWKRDRSAKVVAKAAKSAALPRRTLSLRRHVAPVLVVAFASTWAGCNCGADSTPSTSDGSGSSTGSGAPALSPGLIGAYTSVAVSGTTLWVAGYSEADWNNGNTYGDLVVGKWNGKNVEWASVDGVPTDPPPDPKTVDVDGFRGGQTEAGDDVGIWTSIALDSKGNPAVAYYDRTNLALKLAKFDGAKWSVSVVDGKAGANTGRYAKIVALGGGFVIAYSTVTAGGDKGGLISTVRVATSTSESPGAADWTFEDAVIDKSTPCRATLCGSGNACIAATKACAPELDGAKCTPSCASGSACVDNAGAPSCAVTIDASKIDSYPEVVGDYISIAVDPKGTIGIAYYDRIHGNLGVASHASGAWVAKIIDGEDAMGKDTGDVGIGASLFIDTSNDWHIAYVDGLAESLRYVKLTGGTKASAPEVIDDGLGLAGVPFPDGQHLVGDDSNLVVTPSGEVRVSFQDATAGTLHYAVGSLAADKHTWAVQEIKQENFAGAFSHVVEIDGKLSLVNWWRAGVPDVVGDVAVVTP